MTNVQNVQMSMFLLCFTLMHVKLSKFVLYKIDIRTLFKKIRKYHFFKLLLNVIYLKPKIIEWKFVSELKNVYRCVLLKNIHCQMKFVNRIKFVNFDNILQYRSRRFIGRYTRVYAVYSGVARCEKAPEQ